MKVSSGFCVGVSLYVDSVNGMILSQETGGELEGVIVTQGFDLPVHLKASLTVKMRK